jgi:hypothetical protein
MQLDRDGAQHFPRALTPTETAALRNHFATTVAAGTRLAPPRDGEGDHPKGGGGGPALGDLLRAPNKIARQLLGPAARPVRAVFFEKTPERNWSLGWHQDRTIAVRARVDAPGFTDWTHKSGIHHVVPPFEILERMLTLRLHLDDTGEHNAPLLVAPGSHRLARIAEPQIPAAVSRCGTSACLAAAGDIWAYSTPILHASQRARTPARRRVLQLLYSAEALPGGLEWLGV